MNPSQATDPSPPFVPSPRLARLRESIMARKGSWPAGQNPFLRDVALWRAMRPGQSRVQRRAALLREVVAHAAIEIGPDWTLAGEHLLMPGAQGCAFGFGQEPDAATLARIRAFGLSDAEVAAVRQTVQTADTGTYAVGALADDLALGSGSWGGSGANCVFWGWGWIENHSIRDFARVLREGFAGIRRDIETRRAAADIAAPDFPRQDNFWQAALDICAAGIELGRRYAAHARERARTAADPAERERLERMAAGCARVPAEGARTFHEAVQALWLAHILTCGEDGINANSIGRLDQILLPWYAADIAAGRLTRARAVELMAELACKLYLEYDVQAITLGGQHADGRDAVNELSHVILEATRAVDFIRDLSIRVHAGTPPDFLARAAELMARGGGIPFLFNDDCFVPALTAHGIAPADARDYAPIGCIELTVPGKANPHAVSGWFNSTKCLELALFDGRDPRTGVQLGPRTGALVDHAAFEDLYRAYQRQVDHFARRMVHLCNRGELAQRERGPLPCWSVLTDDCIARGRDITDGGAVYNYHSICFLGTANTADGLVALKRLVYDTRQLAPAAVGEALRADFDGAEPLRQLLLSGAPKYGNDQPEVDDLARRVAVDFIDLMDAMRSPLGGRYVVHLFSFLINLPFGKAVGATPDGRRAGEPLAYSLSAHQGRDQQGATAMLKSLARLPHDRAAGASAAIVELDPALVAGEAGVRRLADLCRTAIGLRIGQLQWNVVTAERLRQAQADPEHYGNLPVRVAGYSQLFRLIDRDLQNHIIARTKHRG